MPYLIYAERRKGLTRGGLVRTRGNRPYIIPSKARAEKIKDAAIKMNISKYRGKRRIIAKKKISALYKIKKV